MRNSKQNYFGKTVYLILVLAVALLFVSADFGKAYALGGQEAGNDSGAVVEEQGRDAAGDVPANDAAGTDSKATTDNKNQGDDANTPAVVDTAGTTKIMGQIHWIDTDHGWNDIIRPTQKPSDPNIYINLYQYTGENKTGATKVTLQSTDPGAPYYCVITPTEGIDYWTYSISNVPTDADTHFYTKGPAFTGYKESADTSEVEQTGEIADGVKLSYINYEINYQPLAIKIMMKPANDPGKVGVNIKLGADSANPDSASINYSGSYTICDSNNAVTNANTSNGNINNLGHNYDLTLNEIPEGIAYKITETGTDDYKVKYDGKEKGVIGASGVQTVITNLSSNAKATLTKKWNDNMDAGKNSEAFKKAFKDSLVLEFSFDSGDFLPETPESLEQQGIEGDITFEIIDNNSTWEVKALHGGSENFPAVYEAGDNTITYRIAEKPLEGYVSRTIDDHTIVNTKATEFNATVNWHDVDCIDDRPEQVTYDLSAYYIDGKGVTQTLDNDFFARYGIKDGQITVDISKDSDETKIHLDNIPMYSDDGYQISYSVTQSDVNGYVTKYDNKDTNHGTNVESCFDGGVIDNVRTDWIQYKATKQWVDGGNDKARPLSTIYLYRYVKGQPASSASPVVIVDENGTSHVISKTLSDDMTKSEMDIDFKDVLAAIPPGNKNLFKYDENGREYVYFAKEVLDDQEVGDGNATNPKYYKTYKDKDGEVQDALYNGGTLINSRIPMVDVSIQKTWKTAAQPNAPKGMTVEFKLMRKAAGDADWSYVQDGDNDMVISLKGFENEMPTVEKVVTLPKCDEQGNAYEYKLEEVSVKAAGSDESILNNGSMEIDGHTYTYSSETLDMDGDALEAAPTDDSNETATLTGYNTISDKMDYKVTKVWSGIDNPSEEYSATMQVSRYDYQGNLDTSFDSSQYVKKLDTDNGFTYTFKDLPVYDSEGYQYTYRATETTATSPEGENWAVHYSYSYDKTKKLAVTTATNYIAGNDTYINVSKKWNDDGNTEARPNVVAQVYDSEGKVWTGKTVTLNEGNGWSGDIGFTEDEKAKLDLGITVKEATVGGMAVDYSGSDVEYPELKSDDKMVGVVRTDIKNGYIYKVENSKTDNRHYNITNTRIGKTSVTLHKMWVDGNRTNDERPDIEITLSKDGNEVGTYKVGIDAVNPGNNNEWIHTIEDLDKYDETGRIYEYTISEVDTAKVKADNYKSTLEVGDYDVSNSEYHSGDTKNYTLTNKREAETEYVVHKVWKDPETTTRRPDIKVNLYYSIGDSEELFAYGEGPLADNQTEEITYRWSSNTDPDAAHDSTCTVKNLMKYSPEDGSEIHYYSMETMANRGEYKTYYFNDAGLTTASEKAGYAANGEYILNRVEADLSLKGIKYWNNMQAGTKAEELDTSGVKIALYQYLGKNRPADFNDNPAKYKVDEITLSEASVDNKNFAFSNVPKYDENGKLYSYEMLETMDGKLGFVYTMDPSGFAITNSFITGEKNNRTITVDKTWNVDNYIAGLVAEGQEDFKFPKITFELYRSEGKSERNNDIDFSKPYAEITVDHATDIDAQNQGNIKKSFPAQLIWSENGIQYKYAVVEKIGGNILPAYTIESSAKTVNINDGAAAYTPANMPEEKTASFTNTYEAQEDFTIKGKKVWKDANKPELRPDDLDLEVYRKANGTADSVAISEVKLTENKDYTLNWTSKGETEWEYEITGDAIAEFAPNGQRWVYTVKEVQTVEGDDGYDISNIYTCSGNANQSGAAKNGVQNMSNITNSLKASYTVSKSWEDNNNEYALRPTTSVVALKRSSDGGNTWEYVTTGNNTNDEEKSDFAPDGEEGDTVNLLSHKLSYGSNKWKYTFTNLAPCDEAGNPYKYEGIEIAVGYGDEVSPCIYTAIAGQPIVLAGSYKVTSAVGDTETKLTNTLDPTELIIMKTWEDDGDAYDSRPKNADDIPQITVKLQRTLAENVDDESSWEDVKNASGNLVTKDLKSREDKPTWNISNLPKCDFSGNEYIYRAVELTEDLSTKAGLTKGYETTYDYDTRDVTKITNSVIYKDSATIKAEKIWLDGNSDDRPSSVTLELTRYIKDDKGQDKNVEYPKPMTIVLDGTADADSDASYGEMDSWEACWTNLPKQDNQGNEYEYKVEEIKIGDTAVANSKAAGYLVTSEYNADSDKYQFSNTEATSFEVTKTFSGDNYADRPSNVTVKLQRTTDGNTWSDVETRVINGFTDNVATKSTTFTDLPKYDADDNLYTYRAIETKIGNVEVDADNFASGYDVSYDNSVSGKTAISNEMRTVNITGYKTWDDQNNYYGLRPAATKDNGKSNVSVKLVTGTAQSSTALSKQPEIEWADTTSDKWKFTFKGLPQYDVNGDIISYQAKETVVNKAYTASSNWLTGDFAAADSGDTVALTNGSDAKGIVNSLITVNVTGTKTWADEVNGSGYDYRPESITLTLENAAIEGTPAVTVPAGTLTWTKDNDNNRWTYEYSNLPMHCIDKSGYIHECIYEVEESGTADLGYKNPSYNSSTTTVDGVKTFVNDITNTIDTKNLKVTKTWNDQKNMYSTRPTGWNKTDGTGIFTVYSSIDEGVTYKKMANQPTCEWTNPSGDETKYIFNAANLQKRYVKDGTKKEILYKVQEDTVPSNYTSEVSNSGLTITNALQVKDLSGTKKWVDNSNAYGTRPDALALKLERSVDGTNWEEVTATPANPAPTWTKNDNEWSYSYSNLPKKNLKGVEYTYRVTETVPTGYHTANAIAADNGTLTNTFDYGSVVINKVFGEQMDNGTADKPLATFTIENEAKTQKFVVKTDDKGKFVQDTDGSYTDVNGNKFWLITGKYTITETSVANAADGAVFAPDKTSYNFEITEDGSSATITNATSGGVKLFVNQPARGDVTVLKIDDKYVYTSSSTPSARNTNKTKLSGAEFNLCLDEAGTKVITKLVAVAGNPGEYKLPDTATGTYKTNDLGVSYLTEGGLITGTYWLVETTTPEGYSLNTAESPKKITVAPEAGTTTVADKTVDVGNTLIEKPFKISKTYEVPNLTAWDADGNKINEAGSSAQADADHKFTFTIERIAGNTPAFKFKKTVTTNNAGIADFGNIPYGEYSVTEADSDAYIPPWFGHITVDSEGVHRGDSTAALADGKGEAYNTLKRGKIVGTKIDTTSIAGQSKPVAGAVIGLYSGDTLLAKATTDATGKYEFDKIPYGNYVVKEVKAPANYTLSTAGKNVSITEDDQTISLTGDKSITDAPVVAELKLHKQQNENSKAAMAGVAFTLTGEDFMGNTITKNATTDADGNLTISGLPVSETSYTLTETKAGDYEAPDSFNVTVSNTADGSSNKAVISVKKISADDGSESAVTADKGVYTVTNTRLRRDFTFDKVSETDGEKDSPLAGAVFSIYSDKNCEGAVYTDEKCTGTATSDAKGKVTFTNLPCGTWYIKETSAPSDFKTGTDIYKVTVGQDGTVESNIKTPVVNEALRGKLSVLKFDEKYVYANGKLTERGDSKEMLADAEFKLCLDKDGTKVIATLVPSDDKGVYVLPEAADGNTKVNDIGVTYLKENGLICGTYWIVETQNPEGYYTKTSECPQQITVAAGTDTNTVADIPVNVANTLIEKPFKISKTYEVPNKVSVDADGSKIDEEGRWDDADDSTHKFTFTVERTSDSKPAFEYKKSVSTDENGIADFGDLPYGKYTVTETATDAYVTPVIGDITIDAQGVHKGGGVLTDGKTEVSNYLKRGKITGTKLDVSSVAGSSVPVKGAVMGLYLDGVCVEKSTTDDKGKYEFTNITFGNYIVKEVKAPDNYLLSTTEKNVSITSDGQEVELTGDSSITDPPAVTDLLLKKVQNEQNNAVMKDVEFTIEGKDFLGNDIRKSGKTDASGKLTISGLPAGKYELTETKVEDFDAPDSFNVVVKSAEDGNSNKLETSLEKVAAKDQTVSKVNAGDSGIYTIENTRIRMDFTFNAVGTDDELDLTHASPLPGAEYNIYADSGCTGDVFTDEKCQTGTVTSDKDGKVTFENLPCGTWYIKENKSPDNYEADPNIYKVVVEQDGTVKSELVTSVNEAIRGEITITKVDVTNADKKIEGSTYALYKLNKKTGEFNKLMEDVTDGGGKVTFENLLIGENYRIEETVAPDGYQVSKNPIEFEFNLAAGKAKLDITGTGDGTITIDEDGNIIWNEPPTCVDVAKEDQAGNRLAGADLQIKDSDGNVVDEWTSEDNEHSVIAVLIAGKTYTLEEVKAPDGYMTAAPQEFTVEEVKVGPDGIYHQKVVMVDEKTASVISKTDENSKPLRGSIFKLSGKLADGSGECTVDLRKSSSYELKNKLIEGETYKLTETDAPAGYELLEDTVVFKLNKDNEIDLVKYNKNAISVKSKKENGKSIYTIEIKNTPLPDEDSVKTGDNTPLPLFFAMMIGAMIMAAGTTLNSIKRY